MDLKDIFPVHYAWLIPVAPLLGATISGFFGAKWIKGKSHWPIWLGVGFAALLSFCLLAQMLQMWHAGNENLTAVHRWSVRRQLGEIGEHLACEQQAARFFGISDCAAHLRHERARELDVGKVAKRIGNAERPTIVHARLASSFPTGIRILELLAERDQRC